MPMLCADTSFLFSLYGNDAHTESALERLRRLAQPVLLSTLNEFELGNALRFAECRKLLPSGFSAKALAALDEDLRAGRCRRAEMPLEEILTEAFALSRRHTLKGGHRSFDILHVAHARLRRPQAFLSFDANQLTLAKACGLTV